MGGQLGSGLTLGMWGKSCGVLLCPRDGEGTKGCAKAPISSGALLVQAGPGIAGCRARSRFVGKAFQNFAGCNFCSLSLSLCTVWVVLMKKSGFLSGRGWRRAPVKTVKLSKFLKTVLLWKICHYMLGRSIIKTFTSTLHNCYKLFSCPRLCW